MKLLAKLPFCSRKYVEALKLLYRAPKSFFLIKRPQIIATKTLVISFPRSGSSWVGAILGSDNESLYLREPVTTSYMLDKANRVSVFELGKCQDAPAYQKYITHALKGKARRANAIFKYPKQTLQNKRSVNLVIKEVNPLTVNLYNPFVDNTIYLVRHPYAVALSYQALNWQSQSLFEQRFEKAHMSQILACHPNLQQCCFWQQMGYLLGWIEAHTKHALTNRHLVTRYEDICAAPEEQFDALCNFSSLAFSTMLKARLIRSISGKKAVEKGNFSLQRNISDVANIKIAYSDKSKHDKLINAYLLAGEHFNQLHQTAVSLSYQQESAFIKWIDD
ncbi:sulfotransferase domain-containing protein [Thalassotalea sediminis]|uniref:sulfotransferase domain-containing protein n=1 Tax=Thalassotalea sediminis TaxID=1759089 RepID=UPI0025730825|nr:sulfotransferase domain-containing protein [Thalassotalea sediminis]